MHSRPTARLAALASLALATPLLGLAAPAAADSHAEVVTEDDVTRQVENTPPTDSWVLYTRPGTPPTSGAFTEGPGSAPLGAGSLQLSTVSASEKVFLFNYDHVGTPLAEVDDIAYTTYRQSGQGQQVAALNLQVDHNGDDAEGFTTLVFEPVYNTDQGTVTDGEWQDWDADGAGRWWSTRDIPGVCAFNCFVSWDAIVAANPGATVLGGVGVNQGSGNPALVSHVDAFTFDGTTYDFEPILDSDGDGLPDGEDTDTKDDCKDGGWQRFTSPTFRNQGQCVSWHVRRR
jgi:hypothetical protein